MLKSTHQSIMASALEEWNRRQAGVHRTLTRTQEDLEDANRESAELRQTLKETKEANLDLVERATSAEALVGHLQTQLNAAHQRIEILEKDGAHVD